MAATKDDFDILIDKKKQPLKEFIDTYAALPELWDYRRQDYKSKLKRRSALKILLASYQKILPEATIEDVKRKINSLRSNYKKELKKINSSKSSGRLNDVYIPSAWTFYAMTFLGDCDKPLLHDDSQRQDEDMEHFISDPESQNAGMVLETRLDQPHSSTPLVFHPRKKRKTPGPIAKQNELLSLVYSRLSKSPEDRSDTSLDLAKVWASKLNTLSGQQRLLAEKAINDILFEAQLGNLTAHQQE